MRDEEEETEEEKDVEGLQKSARRGEKDDDTSPWQANPGR